MEYEDLIKVSKRYLFNEKMSVLFNQSCLLIDSRHFKLELNDNFAYPWELETIFLFFVVSQEQGTSDFKGKNYKQFNKILDCVRNYDNKKLNIISNENLLRDFLLLNAPSQFEVQESYIYRMFRFNYIFNFKNDNINMKEIFIKKFGTQYDEFLFFLAIIFPLHSDKIICKKNTSDIINFLIKQNKKVVFNLLISREQCIEKIHFFAADINDYTTCVKVCNQYPFLKYKDDIYLPLPHCIVPACTTSLLYRITENDDNLRILIGKNVIEQYLKEILEESNTFDEVSGEVEFFIKKQSKRSSDVMCRKGDKYVFFESKSLVPKKDVRCLNEDSIDLNIERICKGINQLYTQLKYFTSNCYNPFHKKENIEKNNCYGILVLLDDSYIKREDIYIKFCELHNVTINSHEYFWIINHLKVCSINNVENYAFSSSSFINSLEKQKNNKESFNYPLTNGLDNQYIQSKKVLEFKNKLCQYYVKFSNILLKEGII